MTIEQRLSRLEAAAGINDLPTNGRHTRITYDLNTKPYTNVSVFTEEYSFTAGDKVRFENSDYTIDHFTQSHCGINATISNGSISKTVPLSDLIPLTTGGASHNWAANHGVKDWEITAFRSTGKEQVADKIVLEDGGYTYDHKRYNTIKEMLYGEDSVEDGVFEIYEVRRADGTAWKLGDDAFSRTRDHNGSIDRFLIIDSVNMGVEFKNVPLLTFNLNDLVATIPSVKEWEIVEFRATNPEKNFSMTLSNDGSGYCNSAGYKTGGVSFKNMMTGEQSIKSGHYTIGSVRRISDSALFTIGDRINYPNLQHSPGGCFIEHFTISDGEIFVNNHQNGTPHTRIKDWIEWPVKQAIFTTADGVPAYEGDTIYWLMGNMAGKLNGEIDAHRLHKYCHPDCFPYGYSTRAAAEAAYEKWLYEQPVLTLRDLREVGYNLDNLEALVKDKLAKK